MPTLPDNAVEFRGATINFPSPVLRTEASHGDLIVYTKDAKYVVMRDRIESELLPACKPLPCPVSVIEEKNVQKA